jgi:hypothetical protein
MRLCSFYFLEQDNTYARPGCAVQCGAGADDDVPIVNSSSFRLGLCKCARGKTKHYKKLDEVCGSVDGVQIGTPTT